MKKFYYLAIVSIFFTNCSTPQTVEKNTNINNSNVAVVNQQNANLAVQAESNAVKIQDAAISGENAKLWEGKKGGSTKPAPIDAVTLKNPAPDNSEIFSAMNKEGVPVETRAFKNNPLLVKVERVFIDVENPETRIYLKNGKVINVSPGAIGNPTTASADEILNAAGVTSKAAPRKDETKANFEKKAQ